MTTPIFLQTTSPLKKMLISKNLVKLENKLQWKLLKWLKLLNNYTFFGLIIPIIVIFEIAGYKKR
jgi:hypothetical protein